MQEQNYDPILISEAAQSFISLKEAVDSFYENYHGNENPIEESDSESINTLITHFIDAWSSAAQDQDNIVGADESFPALIEILKNLEEKNKTLEKFNFLYDEVMGITQYTCSQISGALTYLSENEAHEKIIALQDFLDKELEKNHSISTKRTINELLEEFGPQEEKGDYSEQLKAFTDKINENRDSLPIKILQAIFCILTLGALLIVKNPFKEDIFDKVSKELQSPSEKEDTVNLSQNKSTFFGSSSARSDDRLSNTYETSSSDDFQNWNDLTDEEKRDYERANGYW